MMKIRAMFALLAALALTLAFSPAARAADDVSVRAEVSHLRAIQTHAIGENKTDDVYLFITGVANGKEFAHKLPEAKDGKLATMKAGLKSPPITNKKPAALWEGKLAPGEFALITVTLMHGDKLTAEKEKEFLAKKSEAEKKVALRAKKTIDRDEFKTLHTDTLAAHQTLITNIKKIFSRELKTDHYGGMFTLVIWNNDGRITKRIDPVGLTEGAHYGVKPKVYSKIKRTRDNVLILDSNGEWYEFEMEPVTDDEEAIRIKMLETEMVKVEGETDPVRNVTDYLADVRVIDNTEGEAKPLKWQLGGEHPGPSLVHDYWDFAR